MDFPKWSIPCVLLRLPCLTSTIPTLLRLLLVPRLPIRPTLLSFHLSSFVPRRWSERLRCILKVRSSPRRRRRSTRACSRCTESRRRDVETDVFLGTRFSEYPFPWLFWTFPHSDFLHFCLFFMSFQVVQEPPHGCHGLDAGSSSRLGLGTERGL